jgi:serine/threonine-protein kinase
MADPALVINARYQVNGKPIGHGGMGVVYRAYDVVTRRDVAVKTMRGALDPGALELFSKEWSVLAGLCHPNIVDILDTGEFEQDGERKPFFVMPLLPGATLEHLLETASQRLTVERVVGIISQACRGLQAAHERGLIHRDLKPSNIFVMDDDTVKIIDFGVVHLAGTDSVKGIKGTLQYMAPEQVAMKPSSAVSDVFSMGVVCYQALTGRQPFARKTPNETADAIRGHIPPPVSDLNPLVSQLVSRVVHKAMAKEPWHRFASARDFADALQKAINNQPIERFDRAKIQPRIERARKAHDEGDYQFASEILAELEVEGDVDPEMTDLRMQIDLAIRRKSVHQFVEGARTRLREEEFPLALQKIEQALDIDPDNAEALSLRSTIEQKRSVRQTENWFRLVEQHIHNLAFGQARQALQEILKINTKEVRARELLIEVDRREQEITRLRAEKEELYRLALGCYQHGEITSALTKLERLLDLNRQSPDSAIPEVDAKYHGFYNQIQTEREAARTAFAEGRRSLEDRNFAKSLEICAEFLKKYPGDPMFHALKLEAEELQRQEQSSYLALVAQRVEAEPDLDRRVNILKEAADRYPTEAHFQQSLRLVCERRDLVNSIVGKARQYEERGQYHESLGQFDILRNIYPQYPGIEFEAQRLRRRREEQVREEAKARWVDQIDRSIEAGEYTRALDLAHASISEFPGDRELSGLQKLAQQGLERTAEAGEWLQRGQKLCAEGRFAEGLEAIRKAASLDGRNQAIRAAMLNALREQARTVLREDWRAAEPLIEQALSIDAGDPLAKSLQGLVLDYKRQERVNRCIGEARELQVAGDLNSALAKVDEALASYPNEPRLAQLRSTLRNLGAKTSNLTPPVLELKRPLVGERPPQPKDPQTTGATIPLGNEEKPRVEPALIPTVETTSAPPAASVPEPPAPVAIPAPAPDSGGENVPRQASRRFRRALALLQRMGEPNGRTPVLQWAMLAAVPVILSIALMVTLSHNQKKAPAPGPAISYPVEFESNIAGATYLIDGKPPAFPLRLSAGAHQAQAVVPGYKPDSKSFSLSPGMPAPYIVRFQLEPEFVHLKLSSDLKSGQISLDGRPPVELAEGGFADDAVPLSAEHTLTLYQSGRECLSFSFRAEPGKAAVLSSRVKARDVDAVVVSNLASQARVYTNGSVKGSTKDQPPQLIPPEGLELSNLTGNAELTLNDGKSSRPLMIPTGNVPALSILVTSDPTIATLQVESNVPEAELVVNGRTRILKLGRARIQLAPGIYSVRIAHEGYNWEERTVELKKGEMLTLPRFDLKPVVRTASLVIEGATRDAEVWIDGRSAGKIEAGGSFKLDDITPEAHRIVLKKADFEDKELPQNTFTAGQSVRFSGTEAQLTPFGILEFRIVPEGATVSYKRADEAQVHTAEYGKTVHVKAGRYQISANAADRVGRQETVAVEPGKSQLVAWVLATVEKKAPTPPKPRVTSDYFQDPGSWKLADGWWVHQGEGVSWLRANQGIFVIEIQRPASKKGSFLRKAKYADWVIDQRDEDNRIDYSLDSGGMEYKVIVDGKVRSKQSVKVGPGDSQLIQIEIRPDRVTVGSQGKTLQAQRPKASEPPGRFGFKGEVALRVHRGEKP